VQCLNYEDPTPKIRASLAMLFFALCVMALCLQVSWRNVRKEVTHRSAPPGLGQSDIGSRGIHTGDGREAFLSAPLPTTSDHYGSDGSGEDDEEVAVTFHHRAAEETKRAASPAPASAYAPASAPASSSKSNLDRQKETYASPSKTTTGVGRGAALMRRYEGNQGNRESSPPRTAHKADREAGAAEEGYGNLPRGNHQSDSEYEEADL
jgi:hypothetical protein